MSIKKEGEMRVYDYVIENSIRGDCVCGKCIDGKENPKQSAGHTVDMIFFKIARKDTADKKDFLSLVKKEFPHWLDGKEHSYLQIGGDIGDQGIALMAMGLGNLLGIWELLTPETIMPFLPEEFKKQMAGQGMITIKTINSTNMDSMILLPYVLGLRMKTLGLLIVPQEAVMDLPHTT